MYIMPMKWSQRRRIIIPSNKKVNLIFIVNAILTSKRKSIKKSTTNISQTHRVFIYESIFKNEQKEVEEIPGTSSKSHFSLININIEKFKISCNTIFDKKKLAFVDEMFHLKEFKVHDYNTKMIKIVKKKIKKTKIDFEMNSALLWSLIHTSNHSSHLLMTISIENILNRQLSIIWEKESRYYISIILLTLSKYIDMIIIIN